MNVTIEEAGKQVFAADVDDLITVEAGADFENAVTIKHNVGRRHGSVRRDNRSALEQPSHQRPPWVRKTGG